MENLQETQVQEVDTLGGWLITHHTQTWDTRRPLTQLQDDLAQANAKVAAAQAEATKIAANLAEYDKEIADALAAKAIADAQPPTGPLADG